VVCNFSNLNLNLTLDKYWKIDKPFQMEFLFQNVKVKITVR